MINPADVIAAEVMGRSLFARRDDLVVDLVSARRAQDRLVAEIGLRAPLSVARLREAADARRAFEEVFRDLQLSQPAPRGDGNAVGERVAHLNILRRFSPQWRDAKLLRIAQVDVPFRAYCVRHCPRRARRRRSSDCRQHSPSKYLAAGDP
jgi:hypothetical protein